MRTRVAPRHARFPPTERGPETLRRAPYGFPRAVRRPRLDSLRPLKDDNRPPEYGGLGAKLPSCGPWRWRRAPAPLRRRRSSPGSAARSGSPASAPWLGCEDFRLGGRSERVRRCSAAGWRRQGGVGPAPATVRSSLPVTGSPGTAAVPGLVGAHRRRGRPSAMRRITSLRRNARVPMAGYGLFEGPRPR
jgi:hypothetical protein